jgi:hypothetical protein
VRTAPGPGRCGLCGQQRQLTLAHVPPRQVGNHGGRVQRAPWVTSPAGAKLGSFKAGPLTVYGLCADCNNLTSGMDDPAYIDFHKEVERYLRPTMRRLLLEPTQIPARVAPGLVARSVLAGMFALNDRLQEHYPEFADELRDSGADRRLPDELSLRLALTSGSHARVGGPVMFMRVLGTRELHSPFADIWFPPLAWCLTSSRPAPSSLGPEISDRWADVSDWIRYRTETTVDLRDLVRRIEFASAPQFGADEWVTMLGDSMAAVEARVVA